MSDIKLEQIIKTNSQNQEAIDLARAKAESGSPIEFRDLITALDHSNLTLNDRKELGRIYDMPTNQITSAVKGYVKNQGIIAELGQVPIDEYSFVNLLLEKWKTTMTFQGIFTIDTPYQLSDDLFVHKDQLEDLPKDAKIKITFADPKSLTAKEILQEIIFQNRKLKLDFNEKEITNAIDRWIYKKKNDLSSDIMMKVAYESPVLAEMMEPEWDRFVEAITEVKPTEAKTMLKHWIWQVKRKMFNLPVKYHTMLVFYGPQEAGKSTVVKDRLCQPVTDFFASTTFMEITDSRNHDVWRNFVLFFDEMGHSATSNLEDIKRKITEDRFNSRILTKNTDTVVVNKSTFIGTSNKDISTLIYDDTGMRRFYQIDCRARLDWAVTDSIDYIKLWQSVDEHGDAPLMADEKVLKNIKRAQSDKRQISMIERWLREREHKPFVLERGKRQKFFEEFVEFDKANNGNGKSDMNTNKFSRQLPGYVMNIPGLEFKRDTSNKAEVWYEFTYLGDVNKDLE